MMKKYDQSVEIYDNRNQSYIPNHPFRILLIDGSVSGKPNVLLNVIKSQRPDIYQIY